MKRMMIPAALMLCVAVFLSGCVCVEGNRGEGSGGTVGQQLVDLKKAKDSGAISDAEYEAQKAKLLGPQLHKAQWWCVKGGHWCGLAGRCLQPVRRFREGNKGEVFANKGPARGTFLTVKSSRDTRASSSRSMAGPMRFGWLKKRPPSRRPVKRG